MGASQGGDFSGTRIGVFGEIDGWMRGRPDFGERSLSLLCGGGRWLGWAEVLFPDGLPSAEINGRIGCVRWRSPQIDRRMTQARRSGGMADALDSKSRDRKGREGSTPSSGTYCHIMAYVDLQGRKQSCFPALFFFRWAILAT